MNGGANRLLHDRRESGSTCSMGQRVGNSAAAMIRGNIAIPGPKSLKRSRPKPRRELPADMPVIFENVKSPGEIKRDRRIRRLRELTE